MVAQATAGAPILADGTLNGEPSLSSFDPQHIEEPLFLNLSKVLEDLAKDSQQGDLCICERKCLF